MKNRKITSETIHDASAMLIREMMEDESANTVPMDLSPAFQNRMEGLLQDRKVKEFKTYRSHRRIWTTVAMIIIALFTWLAVDVKARASIAEWFESVIEGVFHFSFSGSAVDGTMPSYRLGWIPEGGWVKEEIENPGRHYTIAVFYGSQEEPDNVISLSYGRFDEGTVFNIDPLEQEMTQKTITVKGLEIKEYYIDYYNEYNYVWMNEEEHLYFLIWSNFDHDTNIRIIKDILK